MEVIEIFKKICTIEHCSKKAAKLKEFIENFAKECGCEVQCDKAGNILCKKGKPKVCLQAHYDMVCVGKAPNIEVIEEDGYLKAKESSLGADNGIGVAMMLLAAKKFDDVELLFSADEEIGMIGAKGLELEVESKKILNLDTEEEGKVYIGCAGGVDIKTKKNYQRVDLEDEDVYRVSIEDLPGGHSGVDIDKNIPNAIKELGYYLFDIKPKIISINGGEALNAIPKSAKAVIAVKKGVVLPKSDTVKAEKIKLSRDRRYFANSNEIIDMVCAFANGVRGYDKELCLPSVSVNLGKIQTIDDTISIQIFPRANDDILLEKIIKEEISYFESFGYRVETSCRYGAWKPEINEFSKEIYAIYSQEFKEVSYSAIHAGLECGVLLEKLGKDRMIASIGPNISYPHSVNEKCEIDSIKRVYKIVEKLMR
ncbi:MAG: aminoacyl-histidine dipeptidase [Epsilonproteobacteria bacterium]|nr:aminoacyl-histidine dipeptidase [Campylobacterota bacterium]